jgi:N-glycosylase/DNA lyase
VNALSSNFGEEVAEIDGQCYYSFPTLESLHCADCESKLRSLGFGYRAKYIDRCIRQILDHGGRLWLDSLRDLEYLGNTVGSCRCWDQGSGTAISNSAAQKSTLSHPWPPLVDPACVKSHKGRAAN